MNDNEARSFADWINNHECHNPTLRWKKVGDIDSVRMESALVPMDEDDHQLDPSTIGGFYDICEILGVDDPDEPMSEAMFRELCEDTIWQGQEDNTDDSDICDQETNDRINAYVRNDCEMPEVYEDKAWKVWRENDGEFWYIPVDDDRPADDNVIEGKTGELLYLDREDAIDQWGEESIWDLTKCESGVVIYPNGDAIICNWTQGGLNALPRLFVGGVVFLPDENLNLVADAVPSKFGAGDFDELNVIYDPNDNAKEFVEAINIDPQNAWELLDGTIIVTPDGWN